MVRGKGYRVGFVDVDDYIVVIDSRTWLLRLRAVSTSSSRRIQCLIYHQRSIEHRVLFFESPVLGSHRIRHLVGMSSPSVAPVS